MSTLKVGTVGNATNFRPGDEIRGGVFWILDKPAKAVEVRLFWFTQGKGTQDVTIIERVRFDGPERREQREFRFRLPAAPYSFSGKLVSLVWAIEAVALPSNEADRVQITVSPTGREIDLYAREEVEVTDEGSGKPVSC